MPYSVARQIISSRESIGRARDTLVKSLYLKRIAKLLETDEERVIKDLETVRNSLCSLDNIRALVIADVERLENPVAAWSEFIEGRPVVCIVISNLHLFEVFTDYNGFLTCRLMQSISWIVERIG